MQSFQQESESRLAETLELSMFSDSDTWSDYTIDEVDETSHINCRCINRFSFQRNSTVLPTFNEERYLDRGFLVKEDGRGSKSSRHPVAPEHCHQNHGSSIQSHIPSRTTVH